MNSVGFLRVMSVCLLCCFSWSLQAEPISLPISSADFSDEESFSVRSEWDIPHYNVRYWSGWLKVGDAPVKVKDITFQGSIGPCNIGVYDTFSYTIKPGGRVHRVNFDPETSEARFVIPEGEIYQFHYYYMQQGIAPVRCPVTTHGNL